MADAIFTLAATHVFDPLRLAIPAMRRTDNHNVHLLVLVNPKTSLQTFVKSMPVRKTTPSVRRVTLPWRGLALVLWGTKGSICAC